MWDEVLYLNDDNVIRKLPITSGGLSTWDAKVNIEFEDHAPAPARVQTGGYPEAAEGYSFDILSGLNIDGYPYVKSLLAVSFPSIAASSSKVILYDLEEAGASAILEEIPYDATPKDDGVERIYGRTVTLERLRKADNTNWEVDDGFQIIIEDHPIQTDGTGDSGSLSERDLTGVSVRKVMFWNNQRTRPDPRTGEATTL